MRSAVICQHGFYLCDKFTLERRLCWEMFYWLCGFSECHMWAASIQHFTCGSVGVQRVVQSYVHRHSTNYCQWRIHMPGHPCYTDMYCNVQCLNGLHWCSLHCLLEHWQLEYCHWGMRTGVPGQPRCRTQCHFLLRDSHCQGRQMPGNMSIWYGRQCVCNVLDCCNAHVECCHGHPLRHR